MAVPYRQRARDVTKQRAVGDAPQTEAHHSRCCLITYKQPLCDVCEWVSVCRRRPSVAGRGPPVNIMACSSVIKSDRRSVAVRKAADTHLLSPCKLVSESRMT